MPTSRNQATSESGATKVAASTPFPESKRNNTKLSKYVPDVDAMVLNGAAYRYDVKDENEFKSLANQLRSVARGQHESALEIVWIAKATPTHPAGVYVRYKGPIQTRERKTTPELTKATKTIRSRAAK